jgi:hypothetical protein
MRRNNSHPLNIIVFSPLVTDRHDHTHDENEQCPQTEKIIRKDHIEDIEKGPIKKEPSEKKKEDPEFLVIHTENVSRLLTQ